MIAGTPIAGMPVGDGGPGESLTPGAPARCREIVIVRGDTLLHVFRRWEQVSWVAAQIAAITTDGFVRVHLVDDVAIPDGWRATIIGARGCDELNAEFNQRTKQPTPRSLRPVRVLDSSTVEFNGMSVEHCRKHRPGTGYLVWHPPVDLLGFAARMAIKDRIGGVEVMPMLTDSEGTLLINPDDQSVTATLDEYTTASAPLRGGVYDLELVSPGGIVTKPFYGPVTVRNAVTL